MYTIISYRNFVWRQELDSIKFNEHLFKIDEAIKGLNYSQILNAAQLIGEKCISSKNIFIAGNGGSAALANHLATDLSLGLRNHGIKAKASSLSSNSALLTAAGNDFKFENIFSTQLKCLGEKSDLFIAISSSGKSPNIVSALEEAKNMGMQTIALLGFDGGTVLEGPFCDLTIHIKTNIGEYEIVEDVHSIVCHILKIMVKTNFSNLKVVL